MHLNFRIHYLFIFSCVVPESSGLLLHMMFSVTIKPKRQGFRRLLVMMFFVN